MRNTNIEIRNKYEILMFKCLKQEKQKHQADNNNGLNHFVMVSAVTVLGFCHGNFCLFRLDFVWDI